MCGECGSDYVIGKALVQYEPGQFTYSGGLHQTFGHRECVWRRISEWLDSTGQANVHKTADAED